jgi:hypothetical protein
MPCK